MGHLNGFGDVWYHPGGIANLLSLAAVQEIFHVRYDSAQVTKPDGTQRTFKHRSALYYFDTSEVAGTMLVSTVAGNIEYHTDRAYEKAKLARWIQHIMGHPSVQTMKHAIMTNAIRNCLLTAKDINAAENIFRPSLAGLKGKTVRKPRETVPDAPLYLPADVHAMYRDVTLCVDIMYVDRIPFLVTISRDLKFGTVEALSSCSNQQLLVLQVLRVYRRGVSLYDECMAMENSQNW